MVHWKLLQYISKDLNEKKTNLKSRTVSNFYWLIVNDSYVVFVCINIINCWQRTLVINFFVVRHC